MDDIARVAALRPLLAEGQTLESAGAKLDPPISKSTAHRLARLYDLPRKRKWVKRRRTPAMDAVSAEDVSLLLRLARLCEALAAGKNVTESGQVIALSKSATHRLIERHRLPHRKRSMDPAKREQLQKLLKSAASRPAEVARALGVAKSTVTEAHHRTLDALGTFRPRQLKKPQPCPNPNCGVLLSMLPCVACAAREERRKRGLPP